MISGSRTSRLRDILSRRRLGELAFATYWMRPDLSSQPDSLVSTIQYNGNKEHDFLALMNPIVERATDVSAFLVNKPCIDCVQGTGTLRSVDTNNRVEIGLNQKNALRRVLSDSRSYDWAVTVMGSNLFVPTLGFYFATDQPLAVFLFAPAEEYGIGQVLLPTAQAHPSLTFVVVNKSSTDKILSIYASTGLPPRRGSER